METRLRILSVVAAIFLIGNATINPIDDYLPMPEEIVALGQKEFGPDTIWIDDVNEVSFYYCYDPDSLYGDWKLMGKNSKGEFAGIFHKRNNLLNEIRLLY